MANKSFIGEFPAKILQQFKDGLGTINPLMSLVDVAASNFHKQIDSNSNPKKFLRIEASKQGYQQLYTDHIDFTEVRRFIYLSHIAYILAQAESFCNSIQEHPCMKKESKGLARGDILRKTVYVIECSLNANSKIDSPISDTITSNYIGSTELKVLDYFRHLRNQSFHDIEQSEIKGTYEQLPHGKIIETYNFSVSEPSSINEKDVLLYSIVWQNAAMALCSQFIDTEKHIIPYLKVHYENCKKSRRYNGSRNTLIQEFGMFQNHG